ncbi:MAG: M48 family metallopeptidase [Nitrospiria bacterium]
MRSVPKLPDDRINRSASHSLREAFILVVGICFLGGVCFAAIAFSVDLFVRLIPPAFEAQLHDSIWSQVEAQMKVRPGAEAEAVAGLLKRLSLHWEDRPYDFRVGVLEDASPNAFALPGGVILVTSGLIRSAGSENELAFVLGHELGHFLHRDHLKTLGRGVMFNLLLSLVGIGGGEAVSLLGTTGLLTERTFGRDQERDADRFGLELVYQEYGHIGGSLDFFKKLPPHRGAGGNLAQFTETHPVSKERIVDLQEMAHQRGWRFEGRLRPPSVPLSS